MGFYASHVLPYLIDLAMRREDNTAERGRLVPLASGVVVEIGSGSGLNARFLGPHVERLYAVDPSRPLWRLAEPRVGGARVPVTFVVASAEALPLPSALADTVLMTWTLCSIPDPRAALAEMRRVLRPGGHLLFVEHGRSPDGRVRRWQERLTPLWRPLAGGCNLDRPVDALIAGAGFRMREIERWYARGPKPFTYHYRGIAEPDSR